MEALKLRADFSAAFPSHKKAVASLHAENLGTARPGGAAIPRAQTHHTNTSVTSSAEHRRLSVCRVFFVAAGHARLAAAKAVEQQVALEVAAALAGAQQQVRAADHHQRGPRRRRLIQFS